MMPLCSSFSYDFRAKPVGWSANKHQRDPGVSDGGAPALYQLLDVPEQYAAAHSQALHDDQCQRLPCQDATNNTQPCQEGHRQLQVCVQELLGRDGGLHQAVW